MNAGSTSDIVFDVVFVYLFSDTLPFHLLACCVR